MCSVAAVCSTLQYHVLATTLSTQDAQCCCLLGCVLVRLFLILQVVMRLVGANDEILMYHLEKLEWLADTPLLDMLVEQLGPQVRHASTHDRCCTDCQCVGVSVSVTVSASVLCEAVMSLSRGLCRGTHCLSLHRTAGRCSQQRESL